MMIQTDKPKKPFALIKERIHFNFYIEKKKKRSVNHFKGWYGQCYSEELKNMNTFCIQQYSIWK